MPYGLNVADTVVVDVAIAQDAPWFHSLGDDRCFADAIGKTWVDFIQRL